MAVQRRRNVYEIRHKMPDETEVIEYIPAGNVLAAERKVRDMGFEPTETKKVSGQNY